MKLESKYDGKIDDFFLTAVLYFSTLQVQDNKKAQKSEIFKPSTPPLKPDLDAFAVYVGQ